MKRADVIFIVFTLLVLGGVFFAEDVIPTKSETEASGTPGSFLSIGWYCPAPSGDGFDALMSSTNLGNEAVRLRRGSAGGGKTSPIQESDLEPQRRSGVSVGTFGLADAAGLVEAFGSDTTSDLVVSGKGAGVASARCTVQPWDKWFFGLGSTARGRDTYLLIANPFQEEAVIKVRVIGPESESVPARLKDLVIPAQSQLPVFLAEYIPETASFGLEVSATTGRVIVSRYTKAASRDGVKGISLSLGERGPSDTWIFPGGEAAVDGSETISLVNPTEHEALVQIIFPTESEQIAPPGLSEIIVPAGRQRSINVAEHVPRGTRHSTVVLATNGVKVIAERQMIAAVEGGRGYEESFGLPRLAKRWTATIGSPAGGQAALALVNPSRSRALVRVVLIMEDQQLRPAELSGIEIPPDRRVTVDLTSHLGGRVASAVIESLSGEIGVERLLQLGPPYSDFAWSPALAID